MREKVDLLIEARWIAPVDTATVLTGHAVAIRGERIVAVLPVMETRQRFDAAQRIYLGDHLLIPGLINLHTHAAMSLLRGYADDLPLMEWLQKHIWPAEAAHVAPNFVHDGTLLACAEMLKGGITCFNDMYFYPQSAAEAAIKAHMRVVIGITTMEFANNYAADADDYLNKGLAARDQYLDHPLISFALAPHAPYTVSDATFERIATLSQHLDLPIHCHIHETQTEIEDSLTRFGMRPLERLRRLGLLGPNLIAVHGVHLQPDEIQLLAAHSSSIAHCPSSNLKLASGIPPIASALAAGINIGLGSDGAASNNRLDIFTEMRLAALLAKGISGDPAALPAHQALRMATLNGAKALGMENNIGSLTAGKQADLCAIDFSSLPMQPCFDPLSHLVYAGDRSLVSHVWVGGRCCVENKELLTLPENDLKNSARLWQNRLEIRPTT
ncbi:MAG TPA: TRZ/ATZ family hydrolase [Rhodocyclaceae bacterium]|nr:TRZ/ATZ family hydrolase [Rhodocyclaceae bacterium]